MICYTLLCSAALWRSEVLTIITAGAGNYDYSYTSSCLTPQGPQKVSIHLKQDADMLMISCRILKIYAHAPSHEMRSADSLEPLL